MPRIAQQPTRLDLVGIAGGPFGLLMTFALTDAANAPIAWGAVSSPTVVVTDGAGNAVAGAVPTVTSPATGQLLLTWSTTKTTLLGTTAMPRWSLEVTISGNGPLAVTGGRISMVPSTQPGASEFITADLAVSVGTANAAIAVTVAGPSSGGGTGAVDSVNGQTGTVVLAASDVGADATGAAATAQSAAQTFATSAVSAEATTRASADNTNATAITAEATARAAGDTAAIAAAEAASDPVGSAATVQTNLTAEAATARAAEALKLAKASNLSDLANAATARTNLGLGSAATHPSTDFDAAGSAAAAQAASDPAGTSAAETTRAQAAEALLAPLASPALTGTPTAPTKSALTSNTDIATTAYADSAVGVETTRATAAEATKATSAALTTETNRATAAEALLAPLASPALTGTPTAPTKAPATNNTDVATTAYADAATAVETTRATTAEALALAKSDNLAAVATKGTGRLNLRVPMLAPVQAVAVSNVNIASAPSAVDGFSFVSSGLDTLLLTAQTTSHDNGPWVWNGAGSALTRPSDFASGFVLTTGRTVVVLNGTANGFTQWVLGVPSAGLTIDTTAQVWTNLLTTTPFLAWLKANVSPDQLLPAAANTNLGGNRQTNVSQGVSASDGAIVSQLSQGQWAYVMSGCVWTADSPASTLNGSMSAGVVCIAGKVLTVAAVTAHGFTASQDTYIDLADNGDGTANITYTGVANNTKSPALANSGTVLNTVRLAVVVSTGSALTSTAASIDQGNPQFVTATAQFSTTVAAGSNGNAISTATLVLASGTGVPTGGGWAQVAHASGQTYTIAFTGISSATLQGVTVISGTSANTVATGDTVKGITPFNYCDMLGNPIYLSRPYPGAIGIGEFGGASAFSNTLTVNQPVPNMIAPFIIPAGPSRQVKVTLFLANVTSSSAAGTTITMEGVIGNAMAGTVAAINQFKVAVTSDGMGLSAVGYATLAAGSYTAQVAANQAAAGTITVGTGFVQSGVSVELV